MTAYDMRISDLSSDVCSSDLVDGVDLFLKLAHFGHESVDIGVFGRVGHQHADLVESIHHIGDRTNAVHHIALDVLGRIKIRLLRQIADLYAFGGPRSEEHTSELQSLLPIPYAVFCLKKKTTVTNKHRTTQTTQKILTNRQYMNTTTFNSITR